ncbi:hypothetical protein Thiowin_01577 [Thiorhodovibrio winogradskyi]|uniref:Uncharacterized protein n=1 Tax=Thiorhodovibrio winogradskyi TaxID=77007 RepID=A0ABZ0S6K4_9GAMM|nr:hypothetical protein [Thiorhodovibrio winogradskyi]
MAKPNYAFEKRQRDLAKKAKQEAKRQRKIAGTESPENPESQKSQDDTEPTARPGDADDEVTS